MMQPEQPNTPSVDAQPPDAAAAEPTSDEPREGSSPGWWQRLFNRRPAQETEPGGGEAESPNAGASKPLQLTQEELDRRIQSETDRREAKRAAEQRAAERRKLRDEDPWAFAEQERQAEKSVEQDTQLTTFFSQVGLEHDRHSIDPLMEVLPVAERQRIMSIEGAGRGLAGRKLVVQEALKALEKHWKTQGEREAESKLRRNSAFRKQVLAESRGMAVEPELLPAIGTSAADRKVTEILKDYYGFPNPSRHNNAG